VQCCRKLINMKKKILPSLLLLLGFGSCNNDTNNQNVVRTFGKITAGGFDVYYESQGAGEAILFLHAGLQDHRMWEEQVTKLSEQFTVITIDQPFHGNTLGSDTTTLVADVVKHILDTLRVEKTSVVGLSMGGATALDFATMNPQRVNKLILIAPGIPGFERDHKMDTLTSGWYPRFTAALEAKDSAEAARIFTRTWAEGPTRSKDSLKAPVSQYVYNTTLMNIRKHQMAGWPVLSDKPPIVDRLAQIQLPVLIIHGDKDLPYISEGCIYLEETIPGAKRVLLNNVAHMLNIEKPKEVNKLIADFVKGNAVKK
jgi:3-oxoadipate enol-lactonase